MGRVFLISIFVSFALIQDSHAQFEFETQSVARGAYPEIAVDASGELHLVYAQGESLFYKHYDANSKQWSEEENVGLSTEKVHRSDPEIEIGIHDTIHTIVGPNYANKNYGPWLTINPHVIRDTALAVDSKGNVFICRRDGSHGGYLGVQKRSAGDLQFVSLPDPDIAAGFPAGRNNHVYGDIAVNPLDDSIHVVYRHGTPTHCAYRFSTDGGQTWQGGGIVDDDREAPSIAITSSGVIYVVTGRGFLYQKIGNPSEWKKLGQPVEAGRRDRPQIAVSGDGEIAIAKFGGEINVYENGEWSGVKQIKSHNGKPIGFVKSRYHQNKLYAVWEEGDEVSNDEPAGTSSIIFGFMK